MSGYIEWTVRVTADIHPFVYPDDDEDTEAAQVTYDYRLHSFEADILTSTMAFDVRQEMAGRILATLIDTVHKGIDAA